jgi:type II secretion system protein H
MIRPRSVLQQGFTLLELMVVVLIASLLVHLAFVNIGAMIPQSQIESVANRLRANLDFIRSEATLQGMSHSIRFDITNDRYQVVPPVEKALAQGEAPDSEFLALNWTPIEDEVDLIGFQVGSGQATRRDHVMVTFDAFGYTADSALFLQHKHDKDLVYTIQIPGLGGEIKVVSGGSQGVERPIESAKEFDF